MNEFLSEAQLQQIRDRVQAVQDRLKAIKLKQEEARERTKLKSHNSFPEELGSNPGDK